MPEIVRHIRRISNFMWQQNFHVGINFGLNLNN